MSKHAKGKHIQSKAAAKVEKKAAGKFEAKGAGSNDAAAETPVASADIADAGVTAVMPPVNNFQSAMDAFEKKHSDRRKIAKRIGITVLVIVLLLAGTYLGGVYFFSTHFLPNTAISNMDLSFKTPEEVQEHFEGKVGDYSFKVKGHGLNIAITSEEAGLDIDSVAMTDAISSAQDPWRWPIEMFEVRDVSSELTNALSATNLSAVVQSAVDEVNATATDPVDAHIEYKPEVGQYEIVPEVGGTKLDFDTVLADIVVGAMNLEPQIIITDHDLVQPGVLEDDPRLTKALSDANDLIAADVSLMLGETKAAQVGPNEISAWVSITPEFDAVLNEEAMKEWTTKLASQFNTVGSKRTYTRPDGKTITVKGGDYGWKIDSASLANQLSSAILAGEKDAILIPVLQSGSGFNGIGGQDWGSRYVDVDLSEQYARFYDSNGTLIWESAIVSGAPTDGRATPQGVFDINSKGKNVTLIGSDANGDGKPDYETKVTYWMPFKGNSVGFHDATWQSSFGGQRYRNGAGSHGCVNLPYSKAESLYGIIKTGDVVVVHT